VFQKKFSTWRQLWVWLARAERQLGVKTDGEHDISEQQVSTKETKASPPACRYNTFGP
jgi:adenylosuccinate lyase